MPLHRRPHLVRNAILLVGGLAVTAAVVATRPPPLPASYDELDLRVAGMH